MNRVARTKSAVPWNARHAPDASARAVRAVAIETPLRSAYKTSRPMSKRDSRRARRAISVKTIHASSSGSPRSTMICPLPIRQSAQHLLSSSVSQTRIYATHSLIVSSLLLPAGSIGIISRQFFSKHSHHLPCPRPYKHVVSPRLQWNIAQGMRIG